MLVNLLQNWQLTDPKLVSIWGMGGGGGGGDSVSILLLSFKVRISTRADPEGVG